MSAALTADACVDGFVRKEVPDLPVVVWGQCAGLSDAEALASTDEVAADVEAAWGPLSELMGDPIGDANNPDDTFPDAPEGDDGLLDVYVVAGLVNGRARSITTDAIATTYPAPPLAGPPAALTTSAYMVVDRTRGSGAHLKSTIVHELFHAFQFAHNNGGLVQLGPDGRPWKMHWFMEASAVWSEHEFVPEARDPEVYRWVDDFQEASVGLASNKDGNEYASWLWPLFMRQEEGPEIIGATWFNLEGVSGFDNLQQAIGQDVPFEDRFRDFAVRAYNQHLEPGDPIDPAFWDLDPTFPDEPPVEPRAEIGVEVPPDGKVERSTSMPPLWSHSTALITVDVPTVTFDFDSLSGTPVTADLLVLTKDRWERRPGNSGKVCDAEQVIVILANADPSRGADTTATWSATGIGRAVQRRQLDGDPRRQEERGRHLHGAGGQRRVLRARRRHLAVQRQHGPHHGRRPPPDGQPGRHPHQHALCQRRPHRLGRHPADGGIDQPHGRQIQGAVDRPRRRDLARRHDEQHALVAGGRGLLRVVHTDALIDSLRGPGDAIGYDLGLRARWTLRSASAVTPARPRSIRRPDRAPLPREGPSGAFRFHDL